MNQISRDISAVGPSLACDSAVEVRRRRGQGATLEGNIGGRAGFRADWRRKTAVIWAGSQGTVQGEGL